MNHNYLNIVTREEIFSVTHPFLSHKALPFKVRSWSLDLFQDIKRTSVQTSIWVISTNEFIIFRCIFSALHPMSLMLWKDWEPYTLSTPLSSPALTVELILGQLWLFSRVSPDWTNSYLSQSNSPPPHFIYQKSTHQKECPTQGKKKKITAKCRFKAEETWDWKTASSYCSLTHMRVYSSWNHARTLKMKACS